MKMKMKGYYGKDGTHAPGKKLDKIVLGTTKKTIHGKKVATTAEEIVDNII